ncbi:MAG: type II secretion system F family protein [Gammaproteobacteria bacterium]|nr:type II secretion system F family protein [Gammaproteobacteria bacterium]
MPQYDYELVNGDGELTKGQMEAASAAEVTRSLGRDGQTVVAVTETRPPVPSLFRRRLRPVDVVVGLRELATLLRSGVPLGEAVRSQSQGSYHPALAAAFARMSRELVRGANFLAALRAAELPLPDYVYHLIEAGEQTGRLAGALGQAVEQLEVDERVAADMRSALAYPTILVASGIAAVLAVFVFVVPRFANLLEGGKELPLISNVVLGAGLWFNDNAWLVVVGVALIAGVLVVLFRNRRFRQRAVDALARFPVLGQWYTEADTARWASSMGAMLESRVEMIAALRLAARGVRISRRRTILDRTLVDVRGGENLSAALEQHDALTPTGYNLVRVGEQSGQLAEMMRALATLYEENSTRRMKRVLTLIEPVAILLIGAVLGAIMIGVILAMVTINEVPL